MSPSEPVVLPDDVARVVRDAFGQPFGDVERLTGGRSGAATFSVSVDGARYVVRRGNPDAGRQLRCLQIASDRGVAPRLIHADAASGVTIMERIDGVPVRLSAEHPEQITAVARTLRHLHEGPAFPHAANFDEVLSNTDGAVRATGNTGLPPGLVESLREGNRLTTRRARVAPCHNDLNPGNILEARGKVYFVDWDTAANHDPFFDLAEIGVFGCPSPGDRARLLREYLGRTPTSEEVAHTAVGHVVALGFYSAAFFMVSALAGSFDAAAEPLSLNELRAKLGRAAPPPATVAASLFAEMQKEASTESYQDAKRSLATL